MTLHGNLEAIRSIPIHSLLGIKNTGRRISVKCCFHNDKNPSMCVYPNNSFHCFACGAHGKNAIDFVMKLGYTFEAAVTELNKL